MQSASACSSVLCKLRNLMLCFLEQKLEKKDRKELEINKNEKALISKNENWIKRKITLLANHIKMTMYTTSRKKTFKGCKPSTGFHLEFLLRDHMIRHENGAFVVNGFRDICIQVYLGHDRP